MNEYVYIHVYICSTCLQTTRIHSYAHTWSPWMKITFKTRMALTYEKKNVTKKCVYILTLNISRHRSSITLRSLLSRSYSCGVLFLLVWRSRPISQMAVGLRVLGEGVCGGGGMCVGVRGFGWACRGWICVGVGGWGSVCVYFSVCLYGCFTIYTHTCVCVYMHVCVC